MNPSQDPITNKPNECGAAAGTGKCWCDEVTIPGYFKDILQLPEGQCLSKESVAVLQLVDSNLMPLEKYVPLAIRTELPSYAPACERLLDPNTLVRFTYALNLAVITGNLVEQAKAEVYYGKPANNEKLEAIGETLTNLVTKVQEPSAAETGIAADPDMVQLLHGVLGMINEACELAAMISNSLHQGKPIDLVNLKEELGDGQWFQALILNATGIKPSSMLATNIAKLQKRYPNKFTEEQAINRDLVGERQVLEQP